MIKTAIEQLIQSGKAAQARALFLHSEMGRSLTALEKAQYLRRIGSYHDALGQLRPTLFHHNELIRTPNPELALEYVLNLSQLGLCREATFILEKTTRNGFAFFQASGFLALRRLDFGTAYKYFFKAEKASDSTPYQKSTAQVNQLNCLLGVFDYPKAISFGETLKGCLAKEGKTLLLAHTEHFISQAHAFSGNKNSFNELSCSAFSRLEIDLNSFSKEREYFEFYRGRAIANLVLGTKNEIPLAALKKAAWEFHEYHAFAELCLLSEWMKCRESGRYEKFENEIRKTPHPFLRERFQKLGWNPASSDEAFPSGKLDFDFNKGTDRLKPGQLPIRLLQVFLEDQFRRHSIAELYQKVFPDRLHFHPSHSPNLIHQAVRRLNRILKEQKLPVLITSTSDRYHLVLHRKMNVRMPLKTTDEPFLRQWRSLIGNAPVISREAGERLNLSQRSIQLKLKEFGHSFLKVRHGKQWLYGITSQGVDQTDEKPLK